ncbi:MAG: hypothetical protein J6B90_05855 [Lachnospiraceae bacterium]|nr:hypothetical protein [Lachnospiraceae bacterium]
MEQQKIKKVNIVYALLVILIPLIIMIGLLVASILWIEGDAGIVLWSVGIIGGILWFIIGPDQIYRKKRDKRMKELDASGYIRNHTFNADGCTVAVDVAHGKIAMVFKWNPSNCFVLPANRITNVWVDDGKMLGGTRRVSFLFIVDGVKVRVNTFTSNRSWGMQSNYVLEALSKADMMIERLQAAYQTAQAQGNQYYGN